MYKINNIYHGFKLIEESQIDEIQSIARIFQHEKSGARLLHLDNDDNNKVFGIGFRTPPKDDTGLPHILEHCVLSGSRKYTTKEPFMDMIKGSLQTFLNAMTFSDKTIYPVASRNEKDFFNLMDVYLDAVFYPRIYEVPEIFMQEGWHHEIFDPADDIAYRGVVYNEMKGAYSSPERILQYNISKSLFPDTCYRYSSGGDPYEIPKLKYEDFLDFHKNLYHPSNSYIFLYGDGDIDRQLSHINDKYLKDFNYKEIDAKIERQEAFSERNEIKDYYHISQDDSDENKAYLSLNFVLGDNSNLEDYLLNSIISEILINAESAPLKKELIKKGIGEDILGITAGGLQYGLGIVAKNTSIEKKEEFKNTIFTSLEDIVKEGLDKDLIKASINKVEYNLREAAGFPTKGVVYYTLALDSWLYGESPISHFKYTEIIKELRERVQTDYFEKYIESNFINNNHSSLVVIEAKKGLNDKKDQEIEKELRKYKESLSQEELENLIKENEKLRKIQISDDSEEDKATIPKLEISDVNPNLESIPQEVIEEDNLTILFQDIFTSKIAYLDLYFDTSMVKEEEIPYINLLANLLGKIDTKTRSYGDLSNDIYVNTGGIDFSTTSLIKDNNSNKYSPKLIVQGKAIGDRIEKLLELKAELINDSKIEDYARIRELLLQIKSRIEMNIFNQGHSVVSRRVKSYFSSNWKYRERLQGLDFYWFISDLLERFDRDKEEILSNLNKLYKTIFNKNNLIISFTGDQEDFKLVKENIDIITNKLNKDELKAQKYNFKREKSNEAILSPSNVQYVSKGANFKELDYKYSGSMRVLATILNGDYLHNKIRAQGGAYGVGVSFDRAGDMATFSYRDPNLGETLSVYNKMNKYLDDLDISESELTSFIIGSIGGLEPAMTPYMKGQLATRRYISNIKYKDVQKIKDEILGTRVEDIKSFSSLLEDTMKEDFICVLGNENKIKESEDLFNNIRRLMK